MDKILEKAIGGGFEHREDLFNEIPYIVYYQIITMESSFWQALGKACGRESGCNVCLNELGNYASGYSSECKNPKEHLTKGHVYPYIINALKFHEINLTQGFDKAVEYLQELISN